MHIQSPLQSLGLALKVVGAGIAVSLSLALTFLFLAIHIDTSTLDTNIYVSYCIITCVVLHISMYYQLFEIKVQTTQTDGKPGRERVKEWKSTRKKLREEKVRREKMKMSER